MASYYGSGYGGNQQQQSGGGDGFYGNSSTNYGQPSQAPPPQAFQHGNTQQWTAPQPAQPQSSNTNTTQQQQQQQPSFWNPATAATVMSSVANSGFSNDAMIDLASSAGKTFLQSGTARMIPGLEMAFLKLRKYFAVDNRYVKRKMMKILFPFLSKHWKREVCFVGSNTVSSCCLIVYSIYFTSLSTLFLSLVFGCHVEYSQPRICSSQCR